MTSPFPRSVCDMSLSAGYSREERFASSETALANPANSHLPQKIAQQMICALNYTRLMSLPDLMYTHRRAELGFPGRIPAQHAAMVTASASIAVEVDLTFARRCLWAGVVLSYRPMHHRGLRSCLKHTSTLFSVPSRTFLLHIVFKNCIRAYDRLATNNVRVTSCSAILRRQKKALRQELSCLQF